MTEWLTTGEMIDRLQVGEVAESEVGTKVKKNQEGDLIHFERQELIDERAFALNKDFLKLKWRILPKYVTFEEAMKAYFKGKQITLHRDGLPELTFDNSGYGFEVNLPFKELAVGKWAVEEGDSE